MFSLIFNFCASRNALWMYSAPLSPTSVPLWLQCIFLIYSEGFFLEGVTAIGHILVILVINPSVQCILH
jgi:hypothetical protein